MFLVKAMLIYLLFLHCYHVSLLGHKSSWVSLGEMKPFFKQPFKGYNMNTETQKKCIEYALEHPSECS